MPTDTFAGTNAAVIYGGKWSAPFNNAGTQIIAREGANSEFRVNVTGTECRMFVFADGTYHEWTVDGGAPQSAGPGGNVNDYITLFTGLSDASHSIVRFGAGNYIGSTILLEVTGAAPAIAAPSGYTNTQYRIEDASGLSADNSVAYFANEGYDKVRSRGSFRFKATTATIRVWCRKDSAVGRLALCIDGDPDSPAILTPADTWGWSSFTGLDSGAEHTYRVVVQDHTYCYSVMVPSGTMNTAALAALPGDYWIGDSITAGSTITNSDAALNFPQRYGILTNRGWQIAGFPGQMAFGFGQTHAIDPGDANPVPSYVFIGWGFNDQSAGSGVDTTEFRTAVEDIIDQIVLDLPSAKVYWFGILPVSAATSRAAYNAEISGYVTALGDADVIYINTDSLATVSSSDGTHPVLAGATAVGDFLASQVPEIFPTTGARRAEIRIGQIAMIRGL